MTQEVMAVVTRDRHDDAMHTTNSAHDVSGSTGHDRAESHLRRVLLLNASTSGLGGLAALVAGRQVAELLGTGHVPWVRLVGAGLLGFAAFVLSTALASRARLRRDTPSISAGDAIWVLGTIATVALGWYSTVGAAVMGLVAAMVATFGTLQLRFVRRMPSDD
jgi:hypothetical protein